ncbi:MAG: TonB-dependent receptor [Deltaproteobacteria bacterium]|nr:TonB-dependent receptor [Deltaproteobacteria bacterium]
MMPKNIPGRSEATQGKGISFSDRRRILRLWKRAGAFLLLFIPVLLFLTGPASSAQPEEVTNKDLVKLDLEELMQIPVSTVYGASKYEQKTTEAPSSISIVTADQIKKFGYRTLAGILNSLRGFFITNDRNYSYAGVRGFGRLGDYNSRILLLIDGHRVNDNIYDQAFLGNDFPLDIDLIDRVEIIRGPSSSLYGANAFFAVVNVITRRGKAMKALEVSGEAASYNTFKTRLSYGNQFNNKLDMLLSGTAYDSKGQRLFFKEFDTPETNNGITQGTDYERLHQVFMNFAYQDFTLQALYGSRQKGIPTGAFDTVFNDPATFTVDNRGYLDLKYERSLDQWNVMGRLFYDHYNYYGDYKMVQAINKDSALGNYAGAELKIVKQLLERHKATLGAEYRNSINQDQRNYDHNPYVSYLDDHRQSLNWAFYGQDEIALFKNLILNLGVRYDYYETFGGTTNPRLALIYNPFDKSFLKLIYGTAFRAPNVYELYYTTVNQKGNLDLQPETIKTYELIYEQFISKVFRMEATGFYYKINNLISQRTDSADGLITFQNVDEVETKGFEWEMEGKWKNGWEGRLSYTYQDTTNSRTGESLAKSPKHMAKLNIMVPLLKDKLFAGAEGRYESSRKTLSGNETGEIFVANFTLFSRGLLPGLELSGSVYNLFDKQYGLPGMEEHLQDSINQDGRTFRLKLTYRF